MKRLKIIIEIFCIIGLSYGNSNHYSIISVNNNIRNETIIAIDSQTHIDYGLAYPVTYEFAIPSNSNNLQTHRRFKSNQDWLQIIEKTTDDFFNGIEAVRFDYDENTAFVSIAFSDISDTIFIKITDSENNDISSSFSEISKYYDDRVAVVTVTADDWAGWNNQNFIETCQNFRNYNLWLSCAVITDISNQNVWDNIQEQLDLGFIEVISHSRTHPYVPYEYLESEVLGSKQDLVENLDLPNLSRYGIREYIYAWVAPYGEYDQDIDTLVSFGKYLISRMFYWNDNQFSSWDNTLNKFSPVGASIEVGSSLYWGSTDVIELNTTFDTVYSSNGIYHLMTHPNILEWDQDFTWDHLEYISNRKDIWYVGFGHLYLYRFLSNSSQGINLNINKNHFSSTFDFKIHQNYPNPFNPITTIRYDLSEDALVNITIYDMMGCVVKNMVNREQKSGFKLVRWNATNNQDQPVSAGLYLYTIQAGEFRQTKKMVLLK
ncbi:MAG: hypothetical protein CMG74_10170 [Candidatus Marinimicrobia bacterium]|nr:hypothetical protein [Candidatus Neomarinimicrobiota bacterium]|tara:strand:+ start:10311 stop:11777 length:1467 start_codon:yes stop_codon:yes gene_type:complete